jgi:hypothetical protein
MQNASVLGINPQLAVLSAQYDVCLKILFVGKAGGHRTGKMFFRHAEARGHGVAKDLTQRRGGMGSLKTSRRGAKAQGRGVVVSYIILCFQVMILR